MDDFVLALAPAFAAGFAVQQFMEILDPILHYIEEEWKKFFLALFSLVFGFVVVLVFGLRVLKHLNIDNMDVLDAIVTALIISAGTEGFNSIMKFLRYSKDKKGMNVGVKESRKPDQNPYKCRIKRKYNST